MRMCFRLLAMCCGGAMVLLAAAAPPAAAYEFRYNLSSHSSTFFTELVKGRVWIMNWRLQREYHNKVWGLYFNPNGRVYSCNYIEGRYRMAESAWRIVHHRNLGGLINIRDVDEQPDPKMGRNHGPVFYDPETGRLHDESWFKKPRAWLVVRDGWVQESWPRALKHVCRDLPLPADMAINELQTSRNLDKLRKQDPEAAIRHYPGSELRRLGAVGIGAARNKPTVTITDLDRFFAEQNGHIVETPSGNRYAVAIGGRDDELWRLGMFDPDEISDIAYGSISDDSKHLVWSFEKQKEPWRYRIGEAFLALPTGKRYAAHRLMDWIIAEDRAIGLPFLDRNDVGLRFEAGGEVTASTNSGEEIAGKWWWSRGNLNVQLSGVEEVMSYAWQPLAERLGWPG